MRGCGCHTQACPSCHGAGGHNQRVRRCPNAYLPFASCGCTGCWVYEWVRCWTCGGSGVVAAPRPILYPSPPLIRITARRVDARSDLERARAA